MSQFDENLVGLQNRCGRYGGELHALPAIWTIFHCRVARGNGVGKCTWKGSGSFYKKIKILSYVTMLQ